MDIVVQAVVVGGAVLLAGTLPRNLLAMANLRYQTAIAWAVPLMALYLWAFWRYVNGAGPPAATAGARSSAVRAGPVPAPVWPWALAAGGMALVALVLALRVANRLVVLPPQEVPDLSHVPSGTVLALLLMSAPIAGVVEEAAFRGYMQGPIERRYGLAIAILITGTMFALVHLDFTLVLWPYYVAVAAIYGTVTHLTGSIRPAVVLHTAGNVYSNLTLWQSGRAEWQSPPEGASLVWHTGPDAAFWQALAALAFVAAVTAWVCVRLARAARPESVRDAG